MPIQIPTERLPSEFALRAMQDCIGCPLPASYLDFVNKHDGAEPEPNSFKTSNNEVGVHRFIPVQEAAALGASIDGFPAGVIPLAVDDCGNYFYVEPETGAVHFWDHEVEGLDELLAPDVASFVLTLSHFDSARVTLAPGQVARVWIDPSFKPEF